MLHSEILDCHFCPETHAAIRDVFGEDSEPYRLACSGRAEQLVSVLSREANRTHFRFSTEEAERIVLDATPVQKMLNKRAGAARLLDIVDAEWVAKRPMVRAVRAADKRRREHDARNYRAPM